MHFRDLIRQTFPFRSCRLRCFNDQPKNVLRLNGKTFSFSFFASGANAEKLKRLCGLMFFQRNFIKFKRKFYRKTLIKTCKNSRVIDLLKSTIENPYCSCDFRGELKVFIIKVWKILLEQNFFTKWFFYFLVMFVARITIILFMQLR